MANYYNIQLNVYPLSYRGRDWFDWSLATRLSKRTEVKFTPFCRPTQDATYAMAELFYSVPEEQRVEAMYSILKAVWTEAKDLSFQPHFKQIKADLEIDVTVQQNIAAKLQENDIRCEMKTQPNFPVLELRIDGQCYVFNSLYRVWMIESIFSNVLEDQYKSENDDRNHEERKM